MDVRKTKKGKFSFTLDCAQLDFLKERIIDFLESESEVLPSKHLVTEVNVLRHLYYNVIHDFFTRNISLFTSHETEQKFTIKRAEALALLLFLKDCPMGIQELKSGLHKLLS